MNRKNYIIFTICLVCFLGLEGALIAGGVRIQHDYESRGNWVGIEDVNQDGRPDVLIQKNREVIAYFQQENGSFDFTDQKRQSNVIFPQDVFLFDVYKPDQKEAPVLAGFGSEGVRLFPFEDGGKEKQSSRRVISSRTIFRGESSSPPEQVSLIRDVNRDDRPDVLLPVFQGYSVFFREKESFRKMGTIAFSPTGRNQFSSPYLNARLNSTVRFPGGFTGSVLREDRPEFSVFQERLLQVYALPSADNDGKQEVEKVFDRRMEVIDKRKDTLVKHRIPPVFTELDGKGTNDLLVTKAGDGKIYVFRDTGDNDTSGTSQFDEPNQIVTVGGWIVNRKLRDIDGDPHPELLVAYIEEVGVWGALDLISTYTVPVHILVFDNQNGEFSSSPRYRTKGTAKVQLTTQGDNIQVDTPFYFEVAGDLAENDGRKDLLLKQTGDQLDVFAGKKEARFSEEAVKTLDTMDTSGYSSTTIWIKNVTNDQKTDILMLSTDMEKKRNLLQLFLLTEE